MLSAKRDFPQMTTGASQHSEESKAHKIPAWRWSWSTLPMSCAASRDPQCRSQVLGQMPTSGPQISNLGVVPRKGRTQIPCSTLHQGLMAWSSTRLHVLLLFPLCPLAEENVLARSSGKIKSRARGQGEESISGQ
jgi:hypothetical protein